MPLGGAANPQKSLPAAPFCLQAPVYTQGASAPPRGWPNPSSHPPTDPLSRRPFCTWIYPVLSTAADTRSVKPSSSCTYAPSLSLPPLPFELSPSLQASTNKGRGGSPGEISLEPLTLHHRPPLPLPIPKKSPASRRVLKHHFAVIKITLNLARAATATAMGGDEVGA